MNFFRTLSLSVLLPLVGSEAKDAFAQVAVEQTKPGEDDVTRFEDGIREAEQFRRRLLTPTADATSQAQVLAQAIVRFRDLAEKSLEGRPTLSGFGLDAAELVRRVQGSATPIDGVEAFGKFRGRWYGRWDRLRVDHDWGTVTSFDPPRELPGEGSPRVRSSQYAWVGDGFGWNVVAAPAGESAGDVILGTVYHLIDGHPKRVRPARPHVGIEVGQGRLIWLTNGEVFFEEVLSGTDTDRERYAITCFRYRIRDGRLSNDGDAFQAVYTRHPDDRPPWFRFVIDIRAP